jgi:hypothetical protein
MKKFAILGLAFAAALLGAAPARAQTVIFAPANQVTTFGTFGATVVQPVPGFALVQPTNGVFFTPGVVGGFNNTVIVQRRGLFRNRTVIVNGRNRVVVR